MRKPSDYAQALGMLMVQKTLIQNNIDEAKSTIKECDKKMKDTTEAIVKIEKELSITLNEKEE